MAHGGMGSVYVAEDERLDRQVAVKVIHPHLAESPKYSARFKREAQAAARISHPGVVPVYDQGSVDGRGYLVMELVDGKDLRTYLISRQPYTLAAVLDLVSQILRAVAAAHQVGVIHRDLKPENVLVTENGQAKVVDFGLSRSATDASLSSTGTVFGTVNYLAPEIAVGERADARSDLFSVGVILFELLTGRQPGEGDNAVQIAYQRVNQDIPLPSSEVSWLPTEIDELSATLCARNASERPESAAQADALVQKALAALPDELLERPLPALQAAAGADTEVDQSTPTSADTRPLGEMNWSALTLTEIPVEQQVVHTSGAIEAVQENPGNSNRKRLILLLVVVLIIAGALGVWWWWAQYGPGAYRTVPDLTGMSQSGAVAQLRDMELASEITTEFSDDVDEGLVIRTDPEAGGSVHKDGEIIVYVSAGVQMLQIPADLIGLTLEEAEAAIVEAGFSDVSVQEAYSRDAPAGTVTSIDPGEGETVRHDAQITLTVSMGPEPVTMPQLVGTSWEEARQQLDDLGLSANVTEQYSDEVAEGVVISQGSDAGTTLYDGDSIDVVVSLGPEYVEVPNVYGRQVEEATQILEEAGFVVEVNRIASFFNTVGAQSPSAGEQARRGSTVTISVV